LGDFIYYLTPLSPSPTGFVVEIVISDGRRGGRDKEGPAPLLDAPVRVFMLRRGRVYNDRKTMLGDE